MLCTHGDILADAMNTLVRHGTALTTPPDWRKGSVWVLDDDLTQVAAEPPPEV